MKQKRTEAAVQSPLPASGERVRVRGEVTTVLSSTPAKRKCPHSNARPLEHGDGSRFQTRGNGWEIREQHHELMMRTAHPFTSKQNHGRAVRLTKRQKRSEIRVSGDDAATLRGRAIEDRLVRRVTHSVLSDVNCVMSSRLQAVSYA
jgi:hypothetical protein